MTQTDSTKSLLEMDLRAGTDDWSPTPHGHWLARMLAENDLVSGRDVLELGAGVANHTILIHRKGARSIVATEITEELLETSRENFERNCGTDVEIEFRVADWLSTPGRFDTVVANPPFCQSGKQNRRYFIDSLILDAHKRLRPGGELVFIQSSMADFGETERLLDRNGFDVEVVGTTSGPFRDYYFEDEQFMLEIERVDGGYEMRDGVHHEHLRVYRARLREWAPHSNAHTPGQS
jgi:predicted RNA methylase